MRPITTIIVVAAQVVGLPKIEQYLAYRPTVSVHYLPPKPGRCKSNTLLIN
jgi:hypothetical protein